MWLSEVFRRAAFAQTTDEVVTWLVTLEHPDWSAPIRLARDTGVTSLGRTFRASGVDVRFPEISREGVRPGALRLPNADEDDRAAIVALRSARGQPVRVKVELVALSDPDVVTVTLRGLRIAAPRVTADMLEADLAAADYAILRHAGHAFVPSQTPGIF